MTSVIQLVVLYILELVVEYIKKKKKKSTIFSLLHQFVSCHELVLLLLKVALQKIFRFCLIFLNYKIIIFFFQFRSSTKIMSLFLDPC